MSTIATTDLQREQRIVLPEVWHNDDGTLTDLVRRDDGTYARATRSPAFPQPSPEQIDRHLWRRAEVDETSLVRAFQAWVRALAAGEPGTAAPRAR